MPVSRSKLPNPSRIRGARPKSGRAAGGWPKGWAASFAGIPSDFTRPPQGELETRERFE